MTLGVRPNEKEKMNKTANGQGGFYSPRTDYASTRVSTVDDVQKRSEVFGTTSKIKHT